MIRTDEQADAEFGCDSCGEPKSKHVLIERPGTAERPQNPDVPMLKCPHSPFAGKYRQPLAYWIDDGHSLNAKIDGDRFMPVIVCSGRCRKVWCHCATGPSGEDRVDPDPECSDCGGTGDDPDSCALKAWFLEDWMWALERNTFNVERDLPVPIVWWGDPDDFMWRPKR